MVMAVGCTAPAPIPCASRKAISEGIDQANPHRIEPNRKIAIPTSMTRLRPARSDELAEHHRRCGLGEQEGGEDPAIERQAAELGHDLRHRGRDDRRFDRDHEIRRHDGGEHQWTVRRWGGHGEVLGRLLPSLREIRRRRQSRSRDQPARRVANDASARDSTLAAVGFKSGQAGCRSGGKWRAGGERENEAVCRSVERKPAEAVASVANGAGEAPRGGRRRGRGRPWPSFRGAARARRNGDQELPRFLAGAPLLFAFAATFAALQATLVQALRRSGRSDGQGSVAPDVKPMFALQALTLLLRTARRPQKGRKGNERTLDALDAFYAVAFSLLGFMAGESLMFAAVVRRSPFQSIVVAS